MAVIFSLFYSYFAAMFTGIIETLGTILDIKIENTNKRFLLHCSFLSELKVDQSLAHNGICLTIEKLTATHYEVVAIAETLFKTNMNTWQVGETINLERCLLASSRFDGHIVQGHVDTTGTITAINALNGSWEIEVTYNPSQGITVSKGSITLNGISLTVVKSESTMFSVHIIPYTWEHTNLKNVNVGSLINLEFDVIGKYVAKMYAKTLN